MNYSTVYVGMDVHKETFSLCCYTNEMLHKQNEFVVKRITLETNNGIFEGTLEISVFSIDDVKQICDSLMQIENVTKATRID